MSDKFLLKESAGKHVLRLNIFLYPLEVFQRDLLSHIVVFFWETDKVAPTLHRELRHVIYIKGIDGSITKYVPQEKELNRNSQLESSKLPARKRAATTRGNANMSEKKKPDRNSRPKMSKTPARKRTSNPRERSPNSMVIQPKTRGCKVVLKKLKESEIRDLTGQNSPVRIENEVNVLARTDQEANMNWIDGLHTFRVQLVDPSGLYTTLFIRGDIILSMLPIFHASPTHVVQDHQQNQR